MHIPLTSVVQRSIISVTLTALLALSVPGCRTATHARDADRPAVLLVLTNHAELGETGEQTGFYLSEAAHPWAVFTEAGWAVTLASPEGGAAPIDPRSMADPDGDGARFLEKFARDGVVPGTAPLARVDADDYDAVFFAGGHGTMWDFPNNPGVRDTAEAVHAEGGVIAAVCHGPAALVGLRGPDGRPLVAGRRVTAFTNAEEAAVELTDAMPFLLESELRALGAEFAGAPNFERHVVVDGRLVTGQNPASAREAAEMVVTLARARD